MTAERVDQQLAVLRASVAAAERLTAARAEWREPHVGAGYEVKAFTLPAGVITSVTGGPPSKSWAQLGLELSASAGGLALLFRRLDGRGDSDFNAAMATAARLLVETTRTLREKQEVMR